MAGDVQTLGGESLSLLEQRVVSCVMWKHTDLSE